MSYSEIDDYLDNKMLNNAMDLYIQKLKEMENTEMIAPDPTSLRISTRSAVSEISSYVNLAKVCSIFARNIVKYLYNKEDPNYLIRGVFMKNFVLTTHGKNMKNNIPLEELEERLKLLEGKEREHFYNSCTIIVQPSIERKHINIKLFSNGNISMTGCKENIDGHDAVATLLNKMKKYPECFIDTDSLTEEELKKYTKSKKCGPKINGFKDPHGVKITKYDITMINSDFKLNFTIDKEKLYDVILNNTDLMTMYEDHYAGVKIYYYWNMFNDVNDGICKCSHDSKCKGKGNGMGEGKCKKVTVICFQTGSVIITGARSEIQINHVYEDIIKILHKNYNKIIKLSIADFVGISDDVPPDESYIEEMKKNGESFPGSTGIEEEEVKPKKTRGRRKKVVEEPVKVRKIRIKRKVKKQNT